MKTFLHEIGREQRKRIATFLKSKESFDKDSYNRHAVISHTFNDLCSILTEHINYIQEQICSSNYLFFINEFDEKLLYREYHSILNKYYHRRDFSDDLGQKTNGKVRFFLYLSEDYLFRSKIELDKKIKGLYFSIAKFSHSMYIFANNMYADYFCVDDRIIYYYQCLISDKFCDYIKKLRAFKLREKISHSTEMENEEIYNEILELDFDCPLSMPYTDIDLILPEDYLINWKRDIDDFLVTQEEITVGEKQLQIFRQATKNFIADCKIDKLEDIKIFDLMKQINESSSLIDYHQSEKTTKVRVNFRKNLDNFKI